MPYISRNGKGEITASGSGPQPFQDEFLPDDHPEVLAFQDKLKAAGVMSPEDLLKQLDVPALMKSIEATEKELDALKTAIWSFNEQFHDFELGLSSLLYVALHIQPRSSQVPYAIYYSPTSFQARTDILDNVIQQLVRENARLGPLADLWAKLYDKFGNTRRMRNNLAHGMPKNFPIGQKPHARLSAPVFDVIRVGRRVQDGYIPGVTTSDVVVSAKRTAWLRLRVQEVAQLLEAFFDPGNTTLPKRFELLEANLKTPDSL